MSAANDEIEILRSINGLLPQGIDWKQGALDYIAEHAKTFGPEATETIHEIKPFFCLSPDYNHHSHAEFRTLVLNFVNVLSLLKLGGGKRILDVGCGSGWLTHYLIKLGYDAVGIDISPDMIEIARKRLSSAEQDGFNSRNVRETFIVHNIEEAAFISDRPFDAIIFESSFHHFFNPIMALNNLSDTLVKDGLVVLIEGENRKGKLKEEYVEIMNRYRTIERPYSRFELEQIMTIAGFTCFEFFASINGWYSPNDPISAHLREYLIDDCEGRNYCVCSRNEGALQRILPWRQTNKLLRPEPAAVHEANENARSSPDDLLWKYGMRYATVIKKIPILNRIADKYFWRRVRCRAFTGKPSNSQGDAIIFVEGFSKGQGALLWSAPYSRIRFGRSLHKIELRLNSSFPSLYGQEQRISIYSSSGFRKDIILTPGRQDDQVVIIENAAEGSELYLCSDSIFSPAWRGGGDKRLLSFWISLETNNNVSL